MSNKKHPGKTPVPPINEVGKVKGEPEIIGEENEKVPELPPLPQGGKGPSSRQRIEALEEQRRLKKEFGF